MRLIILTTALVALAYLGVKGLPQAIPVLEEKLENKAILGLAESGHAWANVSSEGRNINMTGNTTTVESAENAIAAAEDIWGVKDVNSSIVIAEIEASQKVDPNYKMTIEKTMDGISLSGSVPNADTRDALLRIAHTNYGETNVDSSSVNLAENAPAGWRSAVGSIIFNIGQFETATAVLTPKGLTLNGETVDRTFGEHAQNMMSQALPENYTTAFNITEMVIEPAAGPEEQSMLSQIFSQSKTTITDACEALEVAAEDDVLFDFDSSLIRTNEKPQLNSMAQHMMDCDGSSLAIHGHTDSVGQDLYNQWLSEQRALSGKRYLMTQGVEKNRISTQGHSESRPTATNATAEGRQLNRRIEFNATTNN